MTEQPIHDCPDCGRTLDAGPDSALVCAMCEETFDVLLVPRRRRRLDTCPCCSASLQMGGRFGGRLVCEDCDRQWRITERTWLDPIDDDRDR